jgi:hypothetical protein
MKNVIKDLAPLALLATAIIQWYGIGERSYDAWWMWYQFRDDGGYTTVSMEMTVETYVLSLFLIVCGLLMRSYWQLRSTSRCINLIAVGMLMVGVGWLTLLIMSGFAEIVNR